MSKMYGVESTEGSEPAKGTTLGEAKEGGGKRERQRKEREGTVMKEGEVNGRGKGCTATVTTAAIVTQDLSPCPKLPLTKSLTK
jgi:hypothetical protein